jgi:hypothetical protein
MIFAVIGKDCLNGQPAAYPIPSHPMNSFRTTWLSVAAAVALSLWALAGLQAETTAYVDRCAAQGRAADDCALAAYGR